MSDESISRRRFVKGAAQAAAAVGSAAPLFGFDIVPRHVLGGPGYTAPSNVVNFALIGAGAQGMSNGSNAINGGQNLVAIADIDFGFVDRQLASGGRAADGSYTPERLQVQAAYKAAKRYVDFRRMLEAERNNIDGVIIASPDHGHAVQAKMAMEFGKAVYVQKPLTWSVHEARVLGETARRMGVVTQMGNQGHSLDVSRRVIEWIQAGVLGPIREVHVWTNKPVWPQGIPRPTTQALIAGTAYPNLWQVATGAGGGGGGGGQAAAIQNTFGNVRNVQQPLAAAMATGNSAAPPGVDWDLFIGPAPMVPFHPIYHPFNWRGWVDWGIGALGDMGAHLLDQPFSALKLNLPVSIQASSTPFGMDIDDSPATWPAAMMVDYEFPAREGLPPVKVTWYDGGLMPPHHDLIPESLVLDRNNGGVMYVGEKGVFVHGLRGVEPHHWFPASLKDAADRVPITLPRVPTNHVMNWANAIMGQATPSSAFDFAVPLTETMLLGLVALRTGQGKKLMYDGANMRITNVPAANELLRREYRTGWSL